MRKTSHGIRLSIHTYPMPASCSFSLAIHQILSGATFLFLYVGDTLRFLWLYRLRHTTGIQALCFPLLLTQMLHTPRHVNHHESSQQLWQEHLNMTVEVWYVLQNNLEKGQLICRECRVTYDPKYRQILCGDLSIQQPQHYKRPL